MTTKFDLSVVVPVYNSEATLDQLVERTFAVFSTLGCSGQIVLVDDGCVDKSWQALERLQLERPEHIIAVQLMRNFGQHNALMCGFQFTQGLCVATIDDDLQTPPEEIPKLLAALEHDDLDVVYGAYEEKRHSGWRNLGSWLVQAFYRYVFRSTINPTSFRVMRAEVVRSISSYNLSYTYIDGLIAWSTQRIGQTVVQHHERKLGRSGYSVWKLMLLALNLFTNFSIRPLQVVTVLGFTISLLGILGALYFLEQYLLANITVPGFASTVIVILVLGGVQMLALGIMGEYLGRLHLNVNRRPQFVIRRCLSTTESPRDDLAARRKSPQN